MWKSYSLFYNNNNKYVLYLYNEEVGETTKKSLLFVSVFLQIRKRKRIKFFFYILEVFFLHSTQLNRRNKEYIFISSYFTIIAIFFLFNFIVYLFILLESYIMTMLHGLLLRGRACLCVCIVYVILENWWAVRFQK